MKIKFRADSMTMGLYYFNQRSGGWLKNEGYVFFLTFASKGKKRIRKRKKQHIIGFKFVHQAVDLPS